MKILFESDFFEPDYFQDWIDACEELDIEYKTAKMLGGECLSSFEYTDNVYVFGSIQFMQFLQDNPYDTIFERGRIWGLKNKVNWENYECTSYYPHFSKYMINTPYSMVPYGDLNNLKEHLFGIYGNNNCIFIRPNDGTKSFTGTILAKASMDWERSMKLLGFYDDVVTPSTLCVVSEPVNIEREWRFVIIDGQVITGSLYKERSSPSQLSLKLENIDAQQTVEDQNAWELAARIVEESDFQPDSCYTMDICQPRNSVPYLLEIGSLGCAGLYACDRKKIAKTLKERITDARSGNL